MSTTSHASAQSSPRAQKDSPLSILASVVASSTQETIKVNCVMLGLLKDIPFELYQFPTGYFYSLTQIAQLFFQGSRRAALGHLTADQMHNTLYQDTQSNTIYISAKAIYILGEVSQIPELVVIARLSPADASHGTPDALRGIENLKSIDAGEESMMTITVVCYAAEKRLSLKRNREDRKDLKSKRLSIDTRFSEKLESNSVVVEQMKSSVKLKQQQQAIIDARTICRSGHPDNSASHHPPLQRSFSKGHGSLEHLVSPRSEYPNRELPKPKGYESSQSAHPLGNKNGLPPSNVSHKKAYLAVCEQLFDSQDSAQKMQAQLKEQIRKSATLLYTLSSSGQMIEGLVRSHFRDMQAQYGEKFGHALTDLNRRLVALENNAFGTSHSEAFNDAGGLRSARPKEDGENGLPVIAERSEKSVKRSQPSSE